MIKKIYYTLEEVREKLGISRPSLNKLIAHLGILKKRYGHSISIHIDDIEKLKNEINSKELYYKLP